MKPIRATLRGKAGYHGQGLASLFPYVPWGAKTKVAVESGEGSFVTSRLADANTSSRYYSSSLEQIMNFPPLFKVFEDFCQQALCSEVSIRYHHCTDEALLPGVLRVSATHWHA